MIRSNSASSSSTIAASQDRITSRSRTAAAVTSTAAAVPTAKAKPVARWCERGMKRVTSSGCPKICDFSVKFHISELVNTPPSLTLRGDYRGVPQTGRGSFGLLVQLASEWLGSPLGEATLPLRLAERVGETACKAFLCALRASLQGGRNWRAVAQRVPRPWAETGRLRAKLKRMYLEASAPRTWPHGLPWASWRDTFDTLVAYVTEWKHEHGPRTRAPGWHRVDPRQPVPPATGGTRTA